MSLNVANMKGNGGGKKFVEQDLIEIGSYPARIAQIIDLGVQSQPEHHKAKYGEKPPKRKVQITYELVDEFMKDENGEEIEDKPRWVSEKFNLLPLTSDKATSTARYKAIDPKMEYGGDFTQLLGEPVMVTVTQYNFQGSDRNGVGEVSAMRARDAAKCPELANEAKLFVLEDPDMEVFNSLPEFLQNIIKENVEYPGSVLQQLVDGETAPPKDEKKEEPAEEAEDGDDEEVPW